MKIGEVAARSGTTASSIRYYESVDVLPEPERVGGQRRYEEDVLEKLAAIDIAQRAGFSLDEIRLLLRAAEEEAVSTQLQELAGRRLADVEALIAQAETMKGWLLGAQACECPTLDVCALFDADARRTPPADG